MSAEIGLEFGAARALLLDLEFERLNPLPTLCITGDRGLQFSTDPLELLSRCGLVCCSFNSDS